MKAFKIFLKSAAFLILIPVLYAFVALVGTCTTLEYPPHPNPVASIYLNSNGIHLDLIIAKNNLDASFRADLPHNAQNGFYSFGWGDENFYLNTATWDELTFGNAFGALFLKSNSLMHVSHYNQPREDWKEIQVDQAQLDSIKAYIQHSFQFDASENKILLKGENYHQNDAFYRALGSYSCLYTCNSWVNTCFKKSEINACLWTPFDFGLLYLHTDEKD